MLKPQVMTVLSISWILSWWQSEEKQLANAIDASTDRTRFTILLKACSL